MCFLWYSFVLSWSTGFPKNLLLDFHLGVSLLQICWSCAGKIKSRQQWDKRVKVLKQLFWDTLYVIKIELFVSWLHIECHPSSHESITASSKHPIFLSPYTARACRELQMFLQQARWREKKVLGKFHTAFFIRAFYLSKNITYVQCKN